MNSIQRIAAVTALSIGALTLGACGSMSQREKSTAVGAAVGGVAGSVLSNGSGVGTVRGAVLGGVISNEVGKNKGK